MPDPRDDGLTRLASTAFNLCVMAVLVRRRRRPSCWDSSGNSDSGPEVRGRESRGFLKRSNRTSEPVQLEACCMVNR